MEIYIPILNDKDEIVGHEEKLKVHEKGLLHRAFSILIFNENNEILLQQRALEKYHSPGLWTNTCCGHPNQNEDIDAAVHRRLFEEMGFDCPLDFQFKFHYTAAFSNGLIENEIDYVYLGKHNEDFIPNEAEVADYKWISFENVSELIDKTPDEFTVWFKILIENPDLKAIINKL